MQKITDKINVRRATANDCESMMDLVKELALYERAADQVTVSLNEFIEAGFGESPLWIAFVAEYQNKIVGMALSYPRYSTWKGRKLYLEDIIVTESFRGQSIGKMLFDTTLQYAKDHNYRSLFWQVLNWNEPAINFYKKYNPTFDDQWLNVSIDGL